MQECGVPTPRERRRTPKPKHWIADPAARQSFGKVLDVPWLSADGDKTRHVQIGAARMQHRVAIHVRRYAEQKRTAGEDGWTLPRAADRLATMDYDGLMRILRGDVQMTLLHAADLSTEFGRIVTLAADVQHLGPLPHPSTGP